MTPSQKSEKAEPGWKKIGPCLYRYKGRAYYGLVKHKGKQIRHSLETEDLTLARRPGIHASITAPPPVVGPQILCSWALLEFLGKIPLGVNQ